MGQIDKKIGIGLLGYGGIGRVHSIGYRILNTLYPNMLPPITLEAVCCSNMQNAERAAHDGGYARAYDSIEDLLRDDAVDVIDCSLPNFLREDAICRAAAAGKHIYCEKPLACDAASATRIADCVQKAGVQFGMTFNYRFLPAIIRAKELIEEGAIGDLYHFNAKYYHTGYQNPKRPLSWRMQQEASGGGALVDMGAHIIDLMRYLLGNFDSIQAHTETWITERPLKKDSSEMGKVSVDDAAWLQVKMQTGGIGTLETSRFATGTLDDLLFDIFGSRGALRFHLMDANWLYYFNEAMAAGPRGGNRGWQRLETVQHYPGAVAPPARSIIGWSRTHAENQFSFLRSIAQGQNPEPGILDGLATQFVLDAAYTSAGDKNKWVKIQQVEA